jgi:hypothetical protein
MAPQNHAQEVQVWIACDIVGSNCLDCFAIIRLTDPVKPKLEIQ